MRFLLVLLGWIGRPGPTTVMHLTLYLLFMLLGASWQAGLWDIGGFFERYEGIVGALLATIAGAMSVAALRDQMVLERYERKAQEAMRDHATLSTIVIEARSFHRSMQGYAKALRNAQRIGMLSLRPIEVPVRLHAGSELSLLTPPNRLLVSALEMAFRLMIKKIYEAQGADIGSPERTGALSEFGEAAEKAQSILKQLDAEPVLMRPPLTVLTFPD